MVNTTRPKLRALLFLAAVAVFIAALAATAFAQGVRSLAQPPSCGGTVMGPLDGCEVLSGGPKSRDIQLYWPDGLMAGIARNLPADVHLRSREQMHADARENGIVGTLIGCGLLTLASGLGWTIIRGPVCRR